MKSGLHSPRAGTSLLETTIAMGVLALAIPLVFAAVAASGDSGRAAEAETRAGWIVPACLREIDASRAGISGYFPKTDAGEAFPAAGKIWALGFSAGGALAGAVEREEYERGTAKAASRPIRYFARLAAEPERSATGPATLRVRVSVEYPSSAPVGKRRSLDFLTRIP
jgi:hypothetical protein